MLIRSPDYTNTIPNTLTRLCKYNTKYVHPITEYVHPIIQIQYQTRSPDFTFTRLYKYVHPIIQIRSPSCTNTIPNPFTRLCKYISKYVHQITKYVHPIIQMQYRRRSPDGTNTFTWLYKYNTKYVYPIMQIQYQMGSLDYTNTISNTFTRLIPNPNPTTKALWWKRLLLWRTSWI